MTSPSTRRLLKESTDIHKNPSPYFTASPISDSNLHDWHFTLTGPPAPTPYAHGLYHGRITFPPTYPLRPPSFRFLTPSGRFEVNREICLSISGHHEETWQPAWGVRTALLAIRSEIMGGESRGQVGGMEGSEALRRECARESRGWVCRDCGAGSNEEVMMGWWKYCREQGVEVDVDGEEGQQQQQLPPSPLPADTARETPQHERSRKEGGSQEPRTETEQTLSSSRSAETSMVSAPNGELPLGSAAPTAARTALESIESEPSTASAQAISAPARSPTEPDETLRTTASRSADMAAAPVVTARRAPVANVSEPANSLWLDRAIIGIVFALIILITKRVVNVDDL
ncbi:Ubiquitin-conjugating enzyme [Penicillium oxalicum]|uniref:Ubiquitin-conjugating enzyme n=1 Tax=Penicillium oxalicum TaxID=69781 RepID=UPI0020B7248E|nr:Ubiquitin-conjugating enzyme [Penicillium oxalicum]KAI2789536.1 Ubiquitin-conjugating enzyme [Penicillium oxalicum]